MKEPIIVILFLCTIILAGCQGDESAGNPAEPAPVGTTSAAGNDDEEEVHSASRDEYLKRTEKVREERRKEKERMAAEHAEKHDATGEGEVLYRGSSDSVPKGLLDDPEVMIEVSDDRPGEVVVRRP